MITDICVVLICKYVAWRQVYTVYTYILYMHTGTLAHCRAKLLARPGLLQRSTRMMDVLLQVFCWAFHVRKVQLARSVVNLEEGAEKQNIIAAESALWQHSDMHSSCQNESNANTSDC